MNRRSFLRGLSALPLVGAFISKVTNCSPKLKLRDDAYIMSDAEYSDLLGKAIEDHIRLERQLTRKVAWWDDRQE